jgi:hypothetical protein
MIGVRVLSGTGSFSPHYRAQTFSAAHPASFTLDTRVSFLEGEGSREWNWPLNCIQCQGQECVEVYIHSPNTHSWHGAQLKHRDNFTFTWNAWCISSYHSPGYILRLIFVSPFHLSHLVSSLEVLRSNFCMQFMLFACMTHISSFKYANLLIPWNTVTENVSSNKEMILLLWNPMVHYSIR